MKPTPSRRGFVLAVVAGACCLHTAAQASTLIIGEGPDRSFFVIESPNIGVRTYEIHYTYDVSSPQDGAFLLDQIVASDSSLAFQIFGGDNIYVNSITYDGVTETGLAEPPFTPYWAHWVAGGAAGFPAAEPVASLEWSAGSGLSSPYRIVQPESWDALKFSDFETPPDTIPVPEPAAVLTFASAGWILLRRRRL